MLLRNGCWPPGPLKHPPESSANRADRTSLETLENKRRGERPPAQEPPGSWAPGTTLFPGNISGDSGEQKARRTPPRPGTSWFLGSRNHAVPRGALKSYLRELPEPLMTSELYDEWIQASNIQDIDKRLQGLLGACEKLPTDNLNNFRYLIKFLSKLTEYQDANKMTPGNMAIVLGPNLLWMHTDTNITEMMTTVSLQIVGIIEPIIQHADWFFPGVLQHGSGDDTSGCARGFVHSWWRRRVPQRPGMQGCGDALRSPRAARGDEP
ncbi:hypothetical protein CRUP_038537 [Coryphaenoides rupestris]|nr:hypothetical protein CRUP_038537 [Coryphaenoides rupestris]